MSLPCNFDVLSWRWCIHFQIPPLINHLLLMSKTTKSTWHFSGQKSQINWHKLWSRSLHEEFCHLNIELKWSACLFHNKVSFVAFPSFPSSHPSLSSWKRSASSMTSPTVNSSAQPLFLSFLCPRLTNLDSKWARETFLSSSAWCRLHLLTVVCLYSHI